MPIRVFKGKLYIDDVDMTPYVYSTMLDQRPKNLDMVTVELVVSGYSVAEDGSLIITARGPKDGGS